MARMNGASKESIEQMLSAYKQSGLTRSQYCQRHGIAETTLDYYQRRLRQLRQREALAATPANQHAPAVRMARVRLSNTAGGNVHQTPAQALGFTLALANGRRLEIADFHRSEPLLARLIRLVEEA